MLRSATSSEPGGRHSGLRALAIAAGVAAGLAFAPAPRAQAAVLLTQDQALALAFPGGKPPERLTSYLTDEQAARVEKEAGQPSATKVVTWYRLDGRTAWFDTHVVRTQRETAMIVIDPAGAIVRIDLLSFAEPPEYQPRAAWLEQFGGMKEGEDLSLRGRIRPISGATLSARAIVGAARRALVLRRLLAAPTAGPAEKQP